MSVTFNIFADIPRHLLDERITFVLAAPNVRIERIVSHGHRSPPGFWYDQDEHEWVIVLRGQAKVRFEGDSSSIALGVGDYVDIPAHRKHRVEWTTPDEPTVWLAVHYGGVT